MQTREAMRGPSVGSSLKLSGFVVTILIAVVAAILIYAATHLNLSGTSSDQMTPAERTVATFYAAAQRQDYTGAYVYFAPQQQAIITSYSFKLSADLLDAQQGKITTYQTIRVDRDPNNASQVVVQESVTRARKSTYTVSLTLAPQSDNSWKIVSESGI